MDTTESGSAGFVLRSAQVRDLAGLVRLIRGLAEYEKLTHQLELTEQKLAVHLFGERPVAEALVVEDRQGSLIGFALFFVSFSTFLGKPGLWLEDLFVVPDQRRHGVGTALLRALARVAVERDYGRFEWSVLDWNEPALRFYERMGASVLSDWRVCRVTGDALKELGANVDLRRAAP